MRCVYICLGLILQLSGFQSFIIPDEVPSLLSVIYSNIPTLKKGTDSRLGWGFRLGDRADFQVLVELGPQTYTQPLGNQVDNGNNKRNAIENLSNNLYAQRQHEKKIQKKSQKTPSQVPNTEGGKWLANWSKSVTPKKKETGDNKGLPLEPRPGLGIGEIDAKSVIPPDDVLELENQRRRQRITVRTPKARADATKE